MCIAPIGRLASTCPELDADFAALEVIIADGILLAMLDGDAILAVPDGIARHEALKAISAPDAVVALLQAVVQYQIAAERHFNAIGGRLGEVIAKNQVVVAAPFPAVHARLPRPEEEAVAGMGGGIVSEDVVAALLVAKDTGRILPPAVEAMAIAAHVPIQAVVHHPVVAGAI